MYCPWSLHKYLDWIMPAGLSNSKELQRSYVPHRLPSEQRVVSHHHNAICGWENEHWLWQFHLLPGATWRHVQWVSQAPWTPLHDTCMCLNTIIVLAHSMWHIKSVCCNLASFSILKVCFIHYCSNVCGHPDKFSMKTFIHQMSCKMNKKYSQDIDEVRNNVFYLK